MKRIFSFVLLISICLFFISCLSTSMVLTGKSYPSLDIDSLVKVILDVENTPEYEEIGLIEVKQTSNGSFGLNEFVEKAKEIARKYGANLIILKHKDINIIANPEFDFEAENYYFIAGRIIEE